MGLTRQKEKRIERNNNKENTNTLVRMNAAAYNHILASKQKRSA